MDASQVVRQFLKGYYHTIAATELDKHLNLWSRRVQLFGVPGREVLYYDDVALRRRNEFGRGLLLRVVFGTPDIRETRDDTVIYRIRETMKATNGFALAFDADVTLVCEPDGIWRIREQRISNHEVIPPKPGEMQLL